jgi:hypothetical protein
MARRLRRSQPRERSGGQRVIKYSAMDIHPPASGGCSSIWTRQTLERSPYEATVCFGPLPLLSTTALSWLMVEDAMTNGQPIREARRWLQHMAICRLLPLSAMGDDERQGLALYWGRGRRGRAGGQVDDQEQGLIKAPCQVSRRPSLADRYRDLQVLPSSAESQMEEMAQERLRGRSTTVGCRQGSRTPSPGAQVHESLVVVERKRVTLGGRCGTLMVCRRTSASTCLRIQPRWHMSATAISRWSGPA